jgi:alpha-methylacyl-CoA racemase
MQAVIAILAALVRRQNTGEGATLDVSVADGVVALMSLYVEEYFATGEIPAPGHNILTGRYACYDVYRCADDGWVAVAAIEPHFFANLCRALDCEQWIPYQTDDAVQDDIRDHFAAAFERRTRDEWVAELGPADTCVSEVATVPELVRAAHFRERAVFTNATAPEHGEFEQVGWVLAGMDRAQAEPLVRDATVTDTDALLGEVGYSAAEIAALRREGVAA